MSIEARWISEALYRAWNAGVSHFFWFSLRDSAPNSEIPLSETIEAGLYFHGATVEQDRPKKVLYAFRFPFVAFPSDKGFTFCGRTPTSTGGRVSIEIQDHGAWPRVGSSRADASGIFDGEVPARNGQKWHGSVRARYRGEKAIPFSLHDVKDFYQPPFGKPVG